MQKVRHQFLRRMTGTARLLLVTGAMVILLPQCDNFVLYPLLDQPKVWISPARISLPAGSFYVFTAAGGNAPYTYTALAGEIGENTGIYTTPAAAGADLVTVTDTAGRTAEAIVTVDIPAVPFSIDPSTAILLVGGSITFGASGGVPPYTYRMQYGGGTVDSLSGEYEASTTPGTDVVGVRDQSGSVSYATVSVMAVQPLAIAPSTLTLQVNARYTFVASGGVTQRNFSVLPGGNGTIDPISGEYTASTDPTPVGTPDVVRVTDKLGVTRDAFVTVVSSGDLTISPLNAKVAENRTAVFTASGGAASYTFTLSGPGSVVEIHEGTAVYTPSSAHVGQEAAIELSDGGASPVTATVIIVPAAPADLAANGATGNPRSIALTWMDDSSSEDGFRIERKGGSDAVFREIAVVGAGVTSHPDTGLSPNTPYTYRIRAYKGGVDSEYSNEAFSVSNPLNP